jgi:hypothetical protein
LRTLRTLFIVALAGLAACTAANITLPPVTDQPTGEHIPGKVVWHDLLTDDVESARHFYGELFGWKFESPTLGQNSAYTLITLNGSRIGGMIDATKIRADVDLTQWVSILSVDDVDAATEFVRTSGGTVFTEPTDLTDRGRISVVADSQGALVALLRTEGGDPTDQEPQIGGFLWDELWTDDPNQSIEFFSELVDYEDNTVAIEGEDYRYLSSAGQPRVGIRKNPLPGLTPTWVTFIRVEDPAAITARVEELGGKVFVEAQTNPIGGQVAIIADPAGAGLVIQSWTPRERT